MLACSSNHSNANEIISTTTVLPPTSQTTETLIESSTPPNENQSKNVSLECKKEYYNYWNDYICDFYDVSVREDSIVTIPSDNNNQYAINFTTIHFHGPQLYKIPTNLCTIFKNLKKIVVKGMKLVLIEQDTFMNGDNMEKIYLSGNLIKKLDANIFVNMKKLRILELNDNEIESIDKDCLNGLVSLERLYLNDNKIKVVPVGIFNALTKLVFLTLDSNQIETIEKDLFLHNNLLKYLGLSNNKIQNISKEVFLKFDNLTDLSMSDNLLRELDLNGTFVSTLVIRNNVELKKLILSNFPKMLVSAQSPIDNVEIIDAKEFQRYPNWNGFWFSKNIIFTFYVKKTPNTQDNIESYDGLIRHHVFKPELDYVTEDGSQYIAVQYLRKNT